MREITPLIEFATRANVRHLPPLPAMQNYGKFDPTSFDKIEQNWANVAFANGLFQIFYTGKSIFSSSASQEDVVVWKSNLGFAYIRRAMGGYRIHN